MCRVIVRLPSDIAIWDRGNTIWADAHLASFDKSARQ
jgi:hypothetical protein